MALGQAVGRQIELATSQKGAVLGGVVEEPFTISIRLLYMYMYRNRSGTAVVVWMNSVYIYMYMYLLFC